MKKFGISLLAAVVGGAIAVGGYKLLENKQQNAMSFEERQEIHYANNPGKVISSTGNPDFTQAAAVVSPAVVHIKTTYSRSQRGGGGGTPFDMFEEFFGVPRGRQQQAQPAQASGSGVIISDDGYIITNNHVVEDADKIEVELTDKRILEAKVIGRDPNTDIALVKVTAKGLPIVKLGDSDDVQIGEWVLAVGYPLGLESTVTAGIVSAKGRSIGILGNSQLERERQRQQQQRGWGQQQDPSQVPLITAIESFIQTDAVINRGNSGGALVNANGELVGINSAIASPSGYYAGYGFAVPVNLVKKIADDFVKFGTVKRGLVGISFQELNRDKAKEFGVEDITGLYVQDAVSGGGAEKAGIRKGDIITKIDGRTILSSSDLQERVYRLRPGDKVKLTYKRDGKEREVTVTLQEDQAASAATKKDEAAKRSATEIYNKLGAGFVPATDAQKKQFGISSGVVVSQVHREGLFDYYNVPRGMVITHVNGKPVNNIDDIENALADTQRGLVRLRGISADGGLIELSFPVDVE